LDGAFFLLSFAFVHPFVCILLALLVRKNYVKRLRSNRFKQNPGWQFTALLIIVLPEPLVFGGFDHRLEILARGSVFTLSISTSANGIPEQVRLQPVSHQRSSQNRWWAEQSESSAKEQSTVRDTGFQAFCWESVL